PSFTDIPQGHWVMEAINYGVEHRYISGESKDIFGFGENMTREAAATMIVLSYFGRENILDTPSSFVDVQGRWSSPYIATLESKGISGFKNHIFKPQGKITRAEFAAMLVKVFDLQLPDNADIPSYHDVT